HPQSVAVEVRTTRSGPGAAAVRARLCTERFEEVVFDGSVIALDGTRGDVALTTEVRHGRDVLVVDNGYLRFRLAPDFLGSIIALETVSDGVNHLLSAYPTAREFGWINPWCGGLHAVVHLPDQDREDSVADLLDEQFTATEASHTARGGRV